MLEASQLGLHMVAATFAGLAIGYWLDKFFKTYPWLTIIFLFLGIIAGFAELFRFARKQTRDNGKEDI
ncbi:MAG TPA: AtpZ/AtpI family protein [Nitrospirae bacterium]|nr:AtpZ/AtpI family protein [Nitrospirota bacterium]HDO23052.1 AtpZ/AtpI family protein [Nitrospirota bacterium]